jgi:cellulase
MATDNFQLPSDIKLGMYVLRTEPLALYSNFVTGTPQFFTHCFNLDISGGGTATPEGVKFPGGYKNDDANVKYNIYKYQNDWDNYVNRIRVNHISL